MGKRMGGNKVIHSVASQIFRIKTLFMAGRVLTVDSIWRTVHTSEARKRISELRREGMDIVDDWKTVDGRRFKIYWLRVK